MPNEGARRTAVEVCMFDAYGTLFDVHSAMARHAGDIGPHHEAVSRLWRQKQLEYTWIRALMGRHADFAVVTADSLDFALASLGIAVPALRAALLDAYDSLSAFPEVPSMLQVLKRRGMRTAILSNGTAAMLDAALRSAGIAELIDTTISIEEVGVYKAAPRVYEHAAGRLGVAPGAISFQSANTWDAAAGSDHGFRVVWVNRARAPREYGWVLDCTEVQDLSTLPDLVLDQPPS